MQPGIAYKWDGIKFRGDAVGGAYAQSRDQDVPSWVKHSPLKSARSGLFMSRSRQGSPSQYGSVLEDTIPVGGVNGRTRSVSPQRFLQGQGAYQPNREGEYFYDESLAASGTGVRSFGLPAGSDGSYQNSAPYQQPYQQQQRQNQTSPNRFVVVNDDARQSGQSYQPFQQQNQYAHAPGTAAQLGTGYNNFGGSQSYQNLNQYQNQNFQNTNQFNQQAHHFQSGPQSGGQPQGAYTSYYNQGAPSMANINGGIDVHQPSPASSSQFRSGEGVIMGPEGSANTAEYLRIHGVPTPQFVYKSGINIGTLTEYAHPLPEYRAPSAERRMSPLGKTNPEWSTSPPYEVDTFKEAEEIINQPYRTRPIITPSIKPKADRVIGSYLTQGLALAGVPRGQTPQANDLQQYRDGSGNIIIGSPSGGGSGDTSGTPHYVPVPGHQHSPHHFQHGQQQNFQQQMQEPSVGYSHNQTAKPYGQQQPGSYAQNQYMPQRAPQQGQPININAQQISFGAANMAPPQQQQATLPHPSWTQYPQQFQDQKFPPKAPPLPNRGGTQPQTAVSQTAPGGPQVSKGVVGGFRRPSEGIARVQRLYESNVLAENNPSLVYTEEIGAAVPLRPAERAFQQPNPMHPAHSQPHATTQV